jgi:hypothetical protein
MPENEKTCSKCHSIISLDEHRSGLVFDDKFFVCEECISTNSEEELMKWSESIMQCPSTGMPIALWLVHEQNKNKSLFSAKRDK